MRRTGMLCGLAVLLAACSSPMRAQTAPSSAPRTQAPSSDGDLRKAPDFTLQTFSGATFKLSDHAGKLPVVLNFWAPW